MNSKITHILMAAALILPGSVMAQAQSSPATVPDAPGATSAAPGGSKVGTINIEAAIFGSNEGQRDAEALNKKLEPRNNELKSRNDDLDALKKQLSTQGDKMNEPARASLVKDIESKQKSLDRDAQDFRDDYQNQQQDIAQKILQKMGPVILKYANDNAFGVILDTSSPWPQGPVLWSNQAVDITKAVVDAYNVQSGVPAPPKPAATTPTRPAGSTTKPAGTMTKPSTNP